MQPLTDDESAQALSERPGWERDGDAIVREVVLPDFAGAVALVTRVADVAEAANHHPDILIHAYNRVRLRLTTHSAGGLTASDFALARQIDELAP